jgi:outer membrane protein
MNYQKLFNKLKAISFFFTTITSVSSVLAFTANAYDVNNAIKSAHEQNYQLLAEFESLKAAQMAKPKAWAGFLPTVSINSGIQKNKLQNSAARSVQTKEKLQTNQLNVSQPIFNGGETYARVKAADYSILSSENRFKAVSNEILLNAVQAYETVLTANEILNLNIKNENVLSENLKFTQTRFKHGEVTKTDVLQAEARYASAIADKEKALGDVKSAEALFERITGTSVPSKIDEINIDLVALPKNLDEFMTIALSNNPNLLSSQANANVAKYNVNIAYSKVLPSVNATAQFTRSDFPKNSISNPDANTYALNVSVPIFQSGAEYASIKESGHLAQKANFDSREVERQVKEACIKAWNNYKVTTALIKAKNETIDAAQKALEGVREEAKIGTRTTLDVLDAERELFSARVDLRSAKRDNIISAFSILQLMGAIDPVAIDKDIKSASYFTSVNYDDNSNQADSTTNQIESNSTVSPQEIKNISTTDSISEISIPEDNNITPDFSEISSNEIESDSNINSEE